MPFQLYPQLPAGQSNKGMVKDELFGELLKQRAPEMTPEQRKARVAGLSAAWKAEGLHLQSPPTGLNGGGGRMGSSFDAQRLILLARSQGREDAMIEEVYAANHSRDECLSDWAVLLSCAQRAGVRDAEATLASGWGVQETLMKIEEYRQMGVTAVPVVVVDSVDAHPIKAVLSSGAPEPEFIRLTLAHLIQTGALPWKPEKQMLPQPQPALNWQPGTPRAPPAQPSGANAPPLTSKPTATPTPTRARSGGGGGGGDGLASVGRKCLGGGGRGASSKAPSGAKAMSRVLDMLGGGSAPDDGGGAKMANGPGAGGTTRGVDEDDLDALDDAGEARTAQQEVWEHRQDADARVQQEVLPQPGEGRRAEAAGGGLRRRAAHRGRARGPAPASGAGQAGRDTRRLLLCIIRLI